MKPKQTRKLAVVLMILSALCFALAISSCRQDNKIIFDTKSHAIKNYDRGVEHFNKGEYLKALESFIKVQPTDTLYFESQDYIEHARNLYYAENKASIEKEKQLSMTWQEQFISYRETNNKDVSRLIITESVLYIYVARITADTDFYSKMYALQFQREYNKYTGFKNTSTLVYHNNRLIKTYDCDNNGLKK